MHFQYPKVFSDELKNSLFSFMNRSKPFDFCEINSMNIRSLKINDYILYLEKECKNCIVESDSKIVAFGSWIVSDQEIEILFLCYFGDEKWKAHEYLKQFLINLKKLNRPIKSIFSKISRKRKRSKMLSWVKRYFPKSKLILDVYPNKVYFK